MNQLVSWGGEESAFELCVVRNICLLAEKWRVAFQALDLGRCDQN